MDTRYASLVLMFLGIYILLDSLHIVSFNVFVIYLLIIVTVSIFIMSKFKIFDKFKNFIIKLEIKGNLYQIRLQNANYYFTGFKIVGKVANDSKIDYNVELQQVVETLKRNKNINLKLAIITVIDPIPGSAILFYQDDSRINESSFINEVLVLKNIIESVAPHISLEPISLNTNPVLPLPKVLGTVVFNGYIGQTKYNVESNQVVIGDYDVELGNLLEYNEVAIGIKSEDVFRHVGIFGSTGTGKSNTAAILALGLIKKGFDVIILDWHGEYKNLLPDFNIYSYNNYLVLNPINVDELTTMDITEIIGEVLELTEPQKFILYIALEALNQTRDFNFRKLLEIISLNISENTFMQRDVKFALMRKLVMLFSGLGEKLFSSTNGYSYLDLGEKLRGGNIIDLSFIRNHKLRKLYALMILRFLFEYAMVTKNKVRKIFIIVEEAQNYFDQANNIITRALQEIRKFNVGLCVISQSPSSVDQEVIKNTNIKIIHSIKSNIDKKVISESLSLDKEKVQILDKLDAGEAMLVAPNLRKEVLIKVKKLA